MQTNREIGNKQICRGKPEHGRKTHKFTRNYDEDLQKDYQPKQVSPHNTPSLKL